MNKYFKFYACTWGVLFAIFNLATFISPNEVEGMTKFGGAFWVGYIFITIAFIGQLAIAFFAFNTNNSQKFFYKIPLIRISWTGLIVILIVGVLCMVIPDLPNWIGVIACFVVLGFNAISLVNANLASNIITEIDDKVAIQTSFVKNLSGDIEIFMSNIKDENKKNIVEKVYEAVRYSDPVSNRELLDIENKIMSDYVLFKEAIIANNKDINTMADELIFLISNRNQRCKLLK